MDDDGNPLPTSKRARTGPARPRNDGIHKSWADLPVALLNGVAQLGSQGKRICNFCLNPDGVSHRSFYNHHSRGECRLGLPALPLPAPPSGE